jgi:hypothetical protein
MLIDGQVFLALSRKPRISELKLGGIIKPSMICAESGVAEE